MRFLPMVLAALALAGCTADAADEADSSDSAYTNEITFNVSTETELAKAVSYGSAERLFGTARADKKLRNDNSPALEAKVKDDVEKLCATVTGGEGKLASTGTPSVRDYRTNPTEWHIEVRLDAKCSAPHDAMKARAAELVSELESVTGGYAGRAAGQAIKALGADGVAPLVKGIRGRVGADGKLVDPDNLALNNMAFELVILEDIAMPTDAVLDALHALRSAAEASIINGRPWVYEIIDHAIEKISAKG
jgi:hypothetical protein